MRNKSIFYIIALLVSISAIYAEAQSAAEDFYWRGFERAIANDLDGAIADYTSAIELNPDYADAYNLRGNIRLEKKDFNGAIADYSKAIQLSPDNSTFFSNRAGARQEQGDIDGAISDYTKAIDIRPDPRSFNDLGLIRQENKDVDGAIADFTRAIELSPEGPNWYQSRAATYRAKNMTSLAEADEKKYEELKEKLFQELGIN